MQKMLTIKGTYKNGAIILENPPEEISSSEVIITFLEDSSPATSNPLKPFHFIEAREATRSIVGNISDDIIEDRNESN